MTYLLDVNVLIAMLDSAHIHHEVVHRWFAAVGSRSWATCPITENAVLRIMGMRGYSNPPANPSLILNLLAATCAVREHAFWPDSISLLDLKSLNTNRLLISGQVTDTYLLALAATHGAKLATLDRRLISNTVPNGEKFLHWIQA